MECGCIAASDTSALGHAHAAKCSRICALRPHPPTQLCSACTPHQERCSWVAARRDTLHPLSTRQHCTICIVPALRAHSHTQELQALSSKAQGIGALPQLPMLQHWHAIRSPACTPTRRRCLLRAARRRAWMRSCSRRARYSAWWPRCTWRTCAQACPSSRCRWGCECCCAWPPVPVCAHQPCVCTPACASLPRLVAGASSTKALGAAHAAKAMRATWPGSPHTVLASCGCCSKAMQAMHPGHQPPPTRLLTHTHTHAYIKHGHINCPAPCSCCPKPCRLATPVT